MLITAPCNGVHTSTGFAPHDLFYTFPSSCALDAMTDGPVEEPVNNADQYALQATERLRESFRLVLEYTGKQTRENEIERCRYKAKVVCRGLVRSVIFTKKEAWHFYALAGFVDRSLSDHKVT